jgi:hypothetical protein
LFQLNAAYGAAGQGLSVLERQDPTINTRTIISVIHGPAGQDIRDAASDGESLEEITRIFTVDIERPDKREEKGIYRGGLAVEWWGDRATQTSSLLPQFSTVSSMSIPFFLGVASLLALLVLVRR